MNLASLYNLIAIFGYFFSAISLFSRLFHPKGPNIILSLTVAGIAIFSHMLLLSNQLFPQHVELDFNLANVISLVALLISASTTILAIKYKVNLLLPVVFGFSGIWLSIEYIVHPAAVMPINADNLLIITHITLSLIAYAVLVISMLYSFQVGYINQKLKNKSLSNMSHLPPLMVVEKQLFFILALGTMLLLFAEISGFLFLENMFAKENIHKTFFSIVALIIYSITLKGHYSYGWRGKKVMIWLIIATFVLTLSYFGSRFVKEFLLS